MKREAQKTETPFGPPVSVGNIPLSSDPIAARYQMDMMERGKYREPVAGGPTPPIPHLDQPFQEGMTMADQARAQMPPPPGPAVQQATQFFGPGGSVAVPQTFQPPTRPANPQAPLFFPTDILPEVARQDPDFQRGQGEMYASSQPRMAYKYGVIRSGKHIPPQQLASGSRSTLLSQETIAGLTAVQNFQQTRAQAESSDPAVVAAAAASPAGQAARMGQSATDGEKPLTEAERARVKNVVSNMDDFDFHTFREMMMKDLLNNDEQKKIVESRLTPMDLTDLVSNGFVTQSVPINSKLTLEFQSAGAEEDLALKRLIIQEAKQTGFHVDDKYILDKYSVMSMTVGVRSINKNPLLDYRGNDGNFDDEKFWKKFNQVVKLNLHLLASIGINFFWFDVRVRRLFVAESLGNG